jgi:hypothetical protein
MESCLSPERRAVTRRLCLASFMLLAPKHGLAQPKLGDEEWMRHFHFFVRAFNRFVDALNDGRFDYSQWESMRVQWKSLDVQ